MNSTEFERVVTEQLEICTDVLLNKAKEYASDTDRLHNFQVVSKLQDISMREAVVGLMSKHTVSIFDLARKPDGSVELEMWEEKITDHINYLLLLKAAIVEEMYANTVQDADEPTETELPAVHNPNL